MVRWMVESLRLGCWSGIPRLFHVTPTSGNIRHAAPRLYCARVAHLLRVHRLHVAMLLRRFVLQQTLTSHRIHRSLFHLGRVPDLGHRVRSHASRE